MSNNQSKDTHHRQGDPGIRKTLWNDLHRSDVVKNIRRDIDDLYEFYIDPDTQKRHKGKARIGILPAVAFKLLKQLILHLTPSRRLLLVLSILAIIAGNSTYQSGSTRIDFHFAIVGYMLVLLILMLELKDKLLARNELETGRAVQAALMPKNNPAFAGWSIWLFTRPANEVGGDLVDSIPLSDSRMGIALGDIAGKGLGAALLMSKLQSTLRALASSFTSLTEMGIRLNEIFCRDSIPSRFASLVYLEIGANSGMVRVMNAGHLPPVVLRHGEIEQLKRVAPALGIMHGAEFVEQSIQLNSGETIILYSDGLTEARNESGDFFGDERLHRFLGTIGSSEPADIGRQLLSTVDSFVGEARPSDDLSLVILTCKL